VDVELKAVLWDLDGTLVDSERYWIRTEMEIAAEHGATWGESEGLAAVGMPIPQTARLLIERGVRATVEELTAELLSRMRDLVRTEGVPYRRGVPELLASLRDAGVRQGVVTMSFGAYVEAIIEQAEPGVFDLVQTGDSVPRGKPDPAIYLTAVAALGLEVGHCLAIEDSPSGVGAILAAGVTPVAVPFLVDLPHDDRLVYLPSLAGVLAEDLHLIHQQWQAGARPAAR